MKFSRRRASCIVVAFGLVILLVVAFGSGCQRTNGGRTIGGTLPLEPQTVRAEETCDALQLPANSQHRGKHIISKPYLGSVSKEFASLDSCTEINEFFASTLQADGWRSLSKLEVPTVFWFDTIHTYRSSDFGLEITCRGWPGFNGHRTFVLSCRWEKL